MLTRNLKMISVKLGENQTNGLGGVHKVGFQHKSRWADYGIIGINVFGLIKGIFFEISL